jgi:hypothetical protein
MTKKETYLLRLIASMVGQFANLGPKYRGHQTYYTGYSDLEEAFSVLVACGWMKKVRGKMEHYYFIKEG